MLRHSASPWHKHIHSTSVHINVKPHHIQLRTYLNTPTWTQVAILLSKNKTKTEWMWTPVIHISIPKKSTCKLLQFQLIHRFGHHISNHVISRTIHQSHSSLIHSRSDEVVLYVDMFTPLSVYRVFGKSDCSLIILMYYSLCVFVVIYASQ